MTTDPFTYHILYDAGDSEPLDLSKETYMMLPAEVSTEPDSGKDPFLVGKLGLQMAARIVGGTPRGGQRYYRDHVSLVGGHQSADLLLDAEPVHSVLHAALPFCNSCEHRHANGPFLECIPRMTGHSWNEVGHSWNAVGHSWNG